MGVKSHPISTFMILDVGLNDMVSRNETWENLLIKMLHTVQLGDNDAPVSASQTGLLGVNCGSGTLGNNKFIPNTNMTLIKIELERSCTITVDRGGSIREAVVFTDNNIAFARFLVTPINAWVGDQIQVTVRLSLVIPAFTIPERRDPFNNIIHNDGSWLQAKIPAIISGGETRVEIIYGFLDYYSSGIERTSARTGNQKLAFSPGITNYKTFSTQGAPKVDVVDTHTANTSQPFIGTTVGTWLPYQPNSFKRIVRFNHVQFTRGPHSHVLYIGGEAESTVPSVNKPIWFSGLCIFIDDLFTMFITGSGYAHVFELELNFTRG